MCIMYMVKYVVCTMYMLNMYISYIVTYVVCMYVDIVTYVVCIYVDIVTYVVCIYTHIHHIHHTHNVQPYTHIRLVNFLKSGQRAVIMYSSCSACLTFPHICIWGGFD